MTELDKLEQYLNDKGYTYDRYDAEEIIGDIDIGRHQLTVMKNGKYWWDAICQYGSYGYEQGLLEIMGAISREKGDVEGWLTAQDVIERIEEEEKHL